MHLPKIIDAHYAVVIFIEKETHEYAHNTKTNTVRINGMIKKSLLTNQEVLCIMKIQGDTDDGCFLALS